MAVALEGVAPDESVRVERASGTCCQSGLCWCPAHLGKVLSLSEAHLPRLYSGDEKTVV